MHLIYEKFMRNKKQFYDKFITDYSRRKMIMVIHDYKNTDFSRNADEL